MKMKSEEEIQDHVSDYYANKRYQNYGRKYHKYVIRGLVGRASGRILDVGCGTGIISELYPNLDIIGIDISEGMLRFNKRRWIKASAEAIPFEDESFDMVICRSLLHHLPDAEKGLTEIRRVLKPGGIFTCWETNAGWLAERIRERTQHGDHFSEYHHSFNNLPELVGNYFQIKRIKYEGFMAYPLFGFPDIIDFSSFMGFFYQPSLLADEILSRIPLINRMGFAVRIKATK